MPGRFRTHNHGFFAALGLAGILCGCSANRPLAGSGFAAGESYLAPTSSEAGVGEPLVATKDAVAGEPASPPAEPAETTAADSTASPEAAPEPVPEPQIEAQIEAPPVAVVDASASRSDAAVAAPSEPVLTAERELERDLRRELASAADPTDVALELAGLLTELERPREALAVLEAAMARRPGPRLSIAHAGVQRDLGQRHLAVAELANLRATQGTLAIAPGVLMELAELQWLEGRPEQALASIAELRRAYGEQAWWRSNGSAVEQLAMEVDTHKAPQRVRLRDLLGNLRGASGHLVRLRTLEEIVRLAEGAQSQGGPDSRASDAQRQALANLRDRAIAIACGDDHATVRARAIQLARPSEASAPELGAAAFADSSPVVRACAAPQCVAWMGPAATPLLLQAMANETDGAAFRAMHEALGAIVTGAPQLPPQDEDKAERRAAVLAAWRLRCQS